MPARSVFVQELESVLFAVTSVSESVDMEECSHLPQLFSVLSRLPYTSAQVVSQALSLIGKALWHASLPVKPLPLTIDQPHVVSPFMHFQVLMQSG